MISSPSLRAQPGDTVCRSYTGPECPRIAGPPERTAIPQDKLWQPVHGGAGQGLRLSGIGNGALYHETAAFDRRLRPDRTDAATDPPQRA